MHVGFHEELLVILQVNHEPGGGELLVSENKTTDDFARCPGVNDVRGPPIGKQSGLLEKFIKGRGTEFRLGHDRQGFLPIRHRDDAGVAGLGQPARKARDVVDAVGREVAVVDEQDVHG